MADVAGDKTPLQSKRATVVSSSYLSQDQIKDVKETVEKAKVNFYSEDLYLSLRDQPFEDGNLVKEEHQKKALTWYKGVADFFYQCHSK